MRRPLKRREQIPTSITTLAANRMLSPKLRLSLSKPTKRRCSWSLSNALMINSNTVPTSRRSFKLAPSCRSSLDLNHSYTCSPCLTSPSEEVSAATLQAIVSRALRTARLGLHQCQCASLPILQHPLSKSTHRTELAEMCRLKQRQVMSSLSLDLELNEGFLERLLS